MIYEPEKKCKVGYVKILKNENSSFFEKIKFWYNYTVCKFIVENAANNIIFKIPIYKEKILEDKNNKKINLIINKLNDEIRNEKIDALVLSNDIKEILPIDVSNEIKVPILNGKFLMKNLIIDILDKILELKSDKLLPSKICILVEKYNKENLDILFSIASKNKNINIITNNIRNFSKFEEKLFNNEGLAISVANNKKKGMKRADIIINFDFSSETLNKYNINRDAVIINCKNEILNLRVGFAGIIINGIELEDNIQVMEYFKIHNLDKDFHINELYESLLFKKLYDKIIQQMKKDNVIIKNFVGNRGIINFSELENSQIKNVSSI